MGGTSKIGHFCHASSEGQPKGCEGQLEGCEGQLEGSEGQPGGSVVQPAGSEGQPDGGQIDVQTYGRMDGIFSRSTGL